MNTFKKAKVVRLYTTNDSNIYLKPQNSHLVIVTDTRVKRYVTALTFPKQHLYITSDDEIKEGDCVYNNKENIVEQITSKTQLIFVLEENKENQTFKKIIATTDTSLNIYTWKQSNKKSKPYNVQQNIETTKKVFIPLPQPSQQFIQKYIEEYNKGNIITDILVEYENIYIDSFGTTIIQCEKDSDSYLKQCEFVTSRLKINPKDNTITIKKLKEVYTKEELCQVLEKYTSFLWSEVGIHYPISLGNDAKDKFINREL